MSHMRLAIGSLLCLFGVGCVYLPPLANAPFEPAAPAAELATEEPAGDRADLRIRDAVLQRRLEVLEDEDPARHRQVQDLLRVTEMEPSPARRRMLQNQVMALVGWTDEAPDEPADEPTSNPPGGDADFPAETSPAPANSGGGQDEPRSARAVEEPAAVDEASESDVAAIAIPLRLTNPAAIGTSVVPSQADRLVDQLAALHQQPQRETRAKQPVEVPSPDAFQPRLSAENLSGILNVATDVDTDQETESSGGPVDWLEMLPEMIDALESEAAQAVNGDQAVRHQAYLRLLYLIANRRDDAVDPIADLPEEEREFFKHVVYSLMVWLDTDQRHASSRKAALSLRELRTAANYLSEKSTLDVHNLAFCKQVTSYGDYIEFKSSAFRPGDEVLLYVEIENFASEAVGQRFETELQGEYAIVDEAGRRVESVVLPRDKQICNNRRRDYFIAYRLFLPSEIPIGEYSLTLTVEDVKGNKSNQATVRFRIR